MAHIDCDQLYRFAAGHCSDAEAEAIYGILLESPEARNLYESVLSLRESFDEHWASFTHAAALPWSLSISIAVDGARRLAVAGIDRARLALDRAVTTAREALEFDLRPSYGGVADPEAAAVRTQMANAAELLGAGSAAKALDSLENAADLVPELHDEVIWEILHEGRKAGQLRLNPSMGVGVLRISEEHDDWRARLFVAATGAEVSLDLEPIEGTRDVAAEFRIPDGGYEVRLVYGE